MEERRHPNVVSLREAEAREYAHGEKFACRTRLLLDPYLCVGPGSEIHADTLFAIAQQSAALGVTLCVERQAWLEAACDPDVVRRRVDLSRFEPIVKLDPLQLPTERDAGALF